MSGLSALGGDFAGDDFVETGGFLPLGGGVFGFTDVAPCAGSTCGVGMGDFMRSGDGFFFTAVFIGAAFFEAAFFATDFFATGFLAAALLPAVADFFDADFAAFFAVGLVDFFATAFFATPFLAAGFFAATFLPALADFFDADFAAFFAAGLVAFFATDFFATAFFAAAFFTGAFFAADFFAAVLLAAAADFFAAGDAFFAADFVAVTGFFFFFGSAASFDLAELLALVEVAFAVLPAAFFEAGLAVDAFDFGDERFMVNSYGRWTWLRMPCERIQRERMS